jgi:glycosyltransferase involved in cell wall biosynthesis
MATRNSEATIGLAIDAILSAVDDYSFRIIVVDGCSTDETLDIVKMKVKDAIILKENSGSIAYAVNKGLEVSNGDYVCFIDSDAVVPIDFFDKMLSHFSKDIAGVEANAVCASDGLVYDYALSYVREPKGCVAADNTGRICLMIRRDVLDFKLDNRLKVAEDTYLAQNIIGVKRKKVVKDYDIKCEHIRGFSVYGDFRRAMRYWYYQALNYYLLPKWIEYSKMLRSLMPRSVVYILLSLLVFPLPLIWILRLRGLRKKRLVYGAVGWLFKLGERVGFIAGLLRWRWR